MAKRRRSDYEGFGCPRHDLAHHIRVEIGANQVEIIEDFGVAFHLGGAIDQEIRCTLSKSAWKAVASTAKEDFNRRLADRGLPTGTWDKSSTRVERMLGKELILLASAAGAADPEWLPSIMAGWASLLPEGRWFLSGYSGSPEKNAALAMTLS